MVAARIALGGLATWTVLVIVLHVLAGDGYDPTAQPISELIRQPWGWLLTVAFAGLAVAGVGLAAGLRALLDPRSPVPALLVACAALWLVTGVVPAGGEDAAAVVHDLTALTSLVLVWTVMLLTPAGLRTRPDWAVLARVTRPWAVSAFGAAVLGGALAGFGVGQRAFVVGWVLWLWVVAGRLERSSAR